MYLTRHEKIFIVQEFGRDERVVIQVRESKDGSLKMGRVYRDHTRKRL